jgi:hypothetical protein
MRVTLQDFLNSVLLFFNFPECGWLRPPTETWVSRIEEELVGTYPFKGRFTRRYSFLGQIVTPRAL